MMKKLLILLPFIFSFLSCNQPKKIPTQQEACFFVPPDASLDSIRNSLKLKKQYLNNYFNSLHKSGAFNGNVLIAEKGKIIYMGAFGNAHNLTKDQLSLETSFQLASVSKIFTAVAVLQLFEKQKIDLDEKVTAYISEFPYEDITVRHLLSHRSGLQRYEAFNCNQWDCTVPMSNNDMIKLYARYKPGLFFRPGKKYDYSNANYGILAAIVARVSGKSFHEYMKENIFEPSGMKQAFVFDIFTHENMEGIAYGHARGYRYPLEPQQDYLNGVVGDKGIYASVLDLYKFDIAMAKGKILKPETQQLAFERTIKKHSQKYDDYGLGHRLKDWRMNGEFIPYHSGWWRGFKTLFIRDIYSNKTIILLSNNEISPQAQLIWNVLEMI